jgi:hypothetical protein
MSFWHGCELRLATLSVKINASVASRCISKAKMLKGNKRSGKMYLAQKQQLSKYIFTLKKYKLISLPMPFEHPANRANASKLFHDE